MATPENSPQLPDPEAHELALAESQFRLTLDRLLRYFSAESIDWSCAEGDERDLRVWVTADVDGTNRQFRTVSIDNIDGVVSELHIVEMDGILEIHMAYEDIEVETDISELIANDDERVSIDGRADLDQLEIAMTILDDLPYLKSVITVWPAAAAKGGSGRMCYIPLRYNKEGRHTRNRSHPA